MVPNYIYILIVILDNDRKGNGYVSYTTAA